MADFAPVSADVLDELKAIVGASGWKTGTDAARFFEDPRDRFAGQASLVLLPETTEEVSKIVRLCNETGTGIIPYGGGTGVVAGQLSPDSAYAVIVSLQRMNKVRSIDPEDFAMVVEAGCILENIHAAAAEHNLMFPLSMASKGSCTIGGNLATNAGGIQVLRHGNARDLCLGIEAVLANGDVVSELAPLRKNNTGYDLRHLLIGSEGTLGIITAATLVLKPVDAENVTAFCALKSPTDALKLFDRLRRALGESLNGMELMSRFGVDLVLKHFDQLRSPLEGSHDWYLLADFAGAHGLASQVEETLAAAFEAGLLDDAALASSEGQRQAIWDMRENTPEANRITGAICSSDTSVPLAKIGDFISGCHDAIDQVVPGLRVNSYGHIGDGNIHHNVFPPEGTTKAEFVKDNPGVIEAVRNAINDVTVACGGSISAEHGIGRLKRKDLVRYGAPTKIAAIRSIKSALDPRGILNPGALI